MTDHLVQLRISKELGKVYHSVTTYSYGVDLEVTDVYAVVESLRTMVDSTETDAQLAARLDVYLNKYLMDAESSKRAVIKDLGGNDRDYIRPEEPDTQLCYLNIKRGAVITFVAKVKSIICRETRTGKLKFYAQLEDNTGVAKIMQWDEPFEFEPDKVYRFRNWKVDYDYYEKIVYIKPSGGTFEELSGVSISSPLYSNNLKNAVRPKDLGNEPLKNITIAGIVSSFSHKTASTKGPAKGTIDMGIKVPFISWNDLDIEPGEKVCITSVTYEYNNYEGRMQFKINDRSEIFKGE